MYKPPFRLFILMLCCIALFSSCSNNKENDAIKILVPKDFYKNKKPVNTSDFISESKAIKLETPKDVYIGTIEKILVKDSLIYVMDRHLAKSLFIFNRQGKFISKISESQTGQPNQIAQMLSFSIDDKRKQLLIWDISPKVFHYSLNGKSLVNIDKYEHQISDVINLNKNLFCFYAPYAIREDKNLDLHKFLIDDSKVSKMEGFEKRNSWDNKIRINFDNVFSKYNNSALALATFSNTIYEIDKDGEANPKYNIDLQEHAIPNDFFKDKIVPVFMTDLKKTNYAFVYGGCFETKNYLVFPLFSHMDKLQHYYYNKTSKEIFGDKRVVNNIPSLLFYNRPITTDGDYIVTYVNSVLVKNLEKSISMGKDQKKSEELTELMKVTKENDNPVLIFYKLK